MHCRHRQTWTGACNFCSKLTYPTFIFFVCFADGKNAFTSICLCCTTEVITSPTFHFTVTFDKQMLNNQLRIMSKYLQEKSPIPSPPALVWFARKRDREYKSSWFQEIISYWRRANRIQILVFVINSVVLKSTELRSCGHYLSRYGCRWC